MTATQTKATTPANNRAVWDEASRAALKSMVEADIRLPKIAAALERSEAAVFSQISRMRKSGDLPKLPIAPHDDGYHPNDGAPLRMACESAELRMLKQVRAMGGFPIAREITVRGQIITIWTGTDPHKLHPLWRAKAGFTPQDQVAA